MGLAVIGSNGLSRCRPGCTGPGVAAARPPRPTTPTPGGPRPQTLTGHCRFPRPPRRGRSETIRAMATTPTIDLDAWLDPIPGANPSGRSLAYEPEYDALREARRAEDDTHQGEWKRVAKVAD